MSDPELPCTGGRKPEAVTPDDLMRICEAYAKVFFPRRSRPGAS